MYYGLTPGRAIALLALAVTPILAACSGGFEPAPAARSAPLPPPAIEVQFTATPLPTVATQFTPTPRPTIAAQPTPTPQPTAAPQPELVDQTEIIAQLKKNADEFRYAIGARGGALTIATISKPLTLNLAIARDASSSGVLGFLFEGLTETSWLTDQVQPALAES